MALFKVDRCKADEGGAHQSHVHFTQLGESSLAIIFVFTKLPSRWPWTRNKDNCDRHLDVEDFRIPNGTHKRSNLRTLRTEIKIKGITRHLIAREFHCLALNLRFWLSWLALGLLTVFFGCPPSLSLQQLPSTILRLIMVYSNWAERCDLWWSWLLHCLAHVEWKAWESTYKGDYMVCSESRSKTQKTSHHCIWEKSRNAKWRNG